MSTQESDGWEPIAPDFPWWLRLLCALIALSLVAVLFWIFSAIKVTAAPAPFPKPPQPVGAGVFDVRWDHNRWLVTLSAGGKYECRWGSIRFEGRWLTDSDGDLHITERLSQAGGNPARGTSYTIKLNAAGVGSTRDWEGKPVRVEFRRIRTERVKMPKGAE